MPFSYLQAKTVEEASAAATQDQAMLIAGGTDLLPRIQQGSCAPRLLVDIAGLAPLHTCMLQPNGDIVLGGALTLAELAARADLQALAPVLSAACRRAATPQIRNLATLGGNLLLHPRCKYYNQSAFWRSALAPCFLAGGDICYQQRTSSHCLAGFYGDAALALAALNAEMTLYGPAGERALTLAQLYAGNYREAVHSGEIICEIIIRRPPPRQVFLKHSLRHSFDFGQVVVAGAAEIDARGICREISLVLGAVAPRPLWLPRVSALVCGKRYEELDFPAIHAQYLAELAPPDEAMCPAAYKISIIPELLQRALAELYQVQVDE